MAAGGQAVTAWPRPSAKHLLELILVSPGQRISRDRACAELFGHLEPRAAARALSKAMSMARSALATLGEPAASLLAADLSHIWLSSHVDVDAENHGAALRAALGMAPGQDRDDRLSAALAEDSELLPDEPEAGWALRPREQLAALRQEARLALARDRSAGVGRSGSDDVLASWQDCFDHDPAGEEAAGALACSWLERGRPELAARVLDRCRAALEDLGLRLSPSLEKLHPAAAGGHEPSAAEPASSVAAPQQREERRPVTVLFAELTAPAGLAGELGLETLRSIVGRSLAAVITEVEGLGGLVTSVSGRGLQAIFGAPEAHEDDPERALRSAFRASAAAAAAADGGIALRMGVETGPAVVGPIGAGGRVEYGALGDVVSIAATLQSAARPGSVLVGPATRAAAGHLFTWGAGEEVRQGGDTRPLVASYLEAPRARPADPRPRLGGRAPLTGRDAEMGMLGQALRDVEEGRGSVIVLTGEPGLGKTRLVQECRKRFVAWVGAGSGRMPLWLEGRGASYASGTPYGLYRQLVAGWIGVATDQPPSRQRPALQAALEALMGNASLLPPLARMLGISPPSAPRIGPEELHKLTFAAIRSVVSRFAAVGPTVLVLEDLHWADPTSVRLTLHLAELAADRSLLLLVTTRPGAGEYVDRLTAAPAAREIRLRPLADDAAGTLAASLIGGTAGPEVLGAVLASAEGNPLFVEERLSSLLETRALVRERGTWRMREVPGPEPSGVLERLVRSRADRLSPGAQEAIRAASVLGTEFTAAELAAVLGSQPAAAAAALDELCASDLVHHEPPESPVSSFRFRHALIQEATYLGLLRPERRSLHARAAAAMEATSRDRLPEVAAVLARHYAAAEDAGRALRYFELAGDHATDAFANDEAIASFRAALAAAAPADAIRLHAKAANVLWRIGRRDEAGDAYREALRFGDSGVADALLRAHLYTRLGRLALNDHGFDAATEAFDTAEALLGDDPCSDDAAADQWLELMVDGRADMHVRRYEPDLALAVLETARPVLDARGSAARRYAFSRLFPMQRLQRNRLRPDESDIAAVRASLEIAAHTGEEKDAAYATHLVAWTHWLRGDLAEARAISDSAVATAERIGESALLDMSLMTLALTAVRAHDAEAVRGLIPRITEAYRKDGAHDYEAGVKSVEAWLAWQDGRPDDVIRLAAQITELGYTTFGSGALYRWVYLWPLIAARLHAGDIEAAVASARQILDPAQQALPGELTRPLEAAIAAWERGAPEAARGDLETALTLACQHAYM